MQLYRTLTRVVPKHSTLATDSNIIKTFFKFINVFGLCPLYKQVSAHIQALIPLAQGTPMAELCRDSVAKRRADRLWPQLTGYMEYPELGQLSHITPQSISGTTILAISCKINVNTCVGGYSYVLHDELTFSYQECVHRGQVPNRCRVDGAMRLSEES